VPDPKPCPFAGIDRTDLATVDRLEGFDPPPITLEELERCAELIRQTPEVYWPVRWPLWWWLLDA
jgi:hypothetical protein